MSKQKNWNHILVVVALLALVMMCAFVFRHEVSVSQHNVLWAWVRMALVTLLFFLAGFVFWLCLSGKKVSKHDAKLKSLEERFADMIRFFKKQRIVKNKKACIASLPWYCVIGQPGVGKTTLLANANHPFVFSKKSSSKTGQTENCDWWVTKTGVFVDVPGVYMHAESKQFIINHFWLRLLQLLRKYRQTAKIAGVIVVFDLHDLCSRPKSSNINRISDIVHALKTMEKTFGQKIPVHVVFNKFDLIPGFIEFFNDLGEEYRSQAWGFDLGKIMSLSAKKTRACLQREINLLIKQVNGQLLWRMHHERNELKKGRIKDFPLQLEAIKPHIIDFLACLFSQLHSSKRLVLQRVYWLSSTQSHSLEDLAATNGALMPAGNHLALPTDSIYQSYFVRGMLTAVMRDGEWACDQSELLSLSVCQGVVVATCCLFVVGAVFLFSKQFSANISAITMADGALTKYHEFEQEPLSQRQKFTETLEILKALGSAKMRLQVGTFQILPSFVLVDAKKNLQLAVKHRYNKSLEKDFLPAFANYLRDYLKSQQSDPARRYVALKLYLMLGHPTRRDDRYISGSLGYLFRDVLSPSKLGPLQKYVKDALVQHPSSVPLDHHVINMARKVLRQMHPTELGYALLYAGVSYESPLDVASLLKGNHVFIIDKAYASISPLYTAKHFNEIYNYQIPTAARAVVKGDWVIGSINNQAKITKDALQKEMLKLYVKQYGESWETLLRHVHFSSMSSLSQLNDALSMLSDPSSPILKLLQLVERNTEFKEVLAANASLTKFAGLINQLNTPGKSLIYHTFSELKALRGSVKGLMSSSQPGKTAFNMTSHYIAYQQDASDDALVNIEQLLPQLPSPLSDWIGQVVQVYWKLALYSTGSYINEKWNVGVLSYYDRHFRHTYPFVMSGKEQVSLDAFTDFLKHGGILDDFERQYVSPFVEKKKEAWSINKSVGTILSLSKKTMDRLQRYALVQAAFFADDGDHPRIDFSLTPLSVDGFFSSVSLSLGEQKMPYHVGDDKHSSSFVWPGSKTGHVVLKAVDKSGKVYQKEWSGPWALFKAVDQSVVGKIGAHTAYSVLRFSIAGHRIEYSLRPSTSYNPFGIVSMKEDTLPPALFVIHRQ
jgi:type VI secretion system protein ImpL